MYIYIHVYTNIYTYIYIYAWEGFPELGCLYWGPHSEGYTIWGVSILEFRYFGAPGTYHVFSHMHMVEGVELGL